ncbi:hypothetical protein [Comamonas thiooxydans]|uniref:hypothetical protein n=1 Tax=Comamonas thiooxydans TaxID=363952 RepID=UPI0021149BA2|nr:hypothetical protein [Comamonas thiooxydans]UUE94436.1 hypothetical protein MJ608_01800 [Comamonas thiooxydans]
MRPSKPEHENIFLCQVETYLGTKEYVENGRCVRLIGVNINEYDELMDGGGEGVTTFTFDLDFWTFCRRIHRFPKLPKWGGHESFVEELESRLHRNRPWYRLDLSVLEHSVEYFYRTFSDDPPTYCAVRSVRKIDITRLNGSRRWMAQRPLRSAALSKSPATIAFSRATPRSAPKPGDKYVFDAFHVGQGMCSLIHNGHTGYLLDAGAGKPVTRQLYLEKAAPFQNDLREVVSSLTTLSMVASHTDYDHWKLLAWDKELLNQVSVILVPDRTNHLLFKDKAIINKCRATATTILTLNKSTTLTLLRADPQDSDANGECLVSVFNRSGKEVLAPGDYVYTRFKSDGTTEIQGLHNGKYEAVIVPHHGDHASSFNIVAPASPKSKAFFSAGTHQGYKHPTATSRKEHKTANFVEICHNNVPYIFQVRLL